MLGIDIANLDSKTLCNLLLYDSLNMNMIDNRIIIEATTEYIEKANRLNRLWVLGCCRGEGWGFFVVSLG